MKKMTLNVVSGGFLVTTMTIHSKLGEAETAQRLTSICQRIQAKHGHSGFPVTHCNVVIG